MKGQFIYIKPERCGQSDWKDKKERKQEGVERDGSSSGEGEGVSHGLRAGKKEAPHWRARLEGAKLVYTFEQSSWRERVFPSTGKPPVVLGVPDCHIEDKLEGKAQ